MKHDLENIEAILEYCDGILATRNLYTSPPHPSYYC